METDKEMSKIPQCLWGQKSVMGGRGFATPVNHFPLSRLAVGAYIQTCSKKGVRVSCKLRVLFLLRPSALYKDCWLPFSPTQALGTCTLPVCTGPVTDRQKERPLSPVIAPGG